MGKKINQKWYGWDLTGEYFECDCHDRGHAIYATHDKTLYGDNSVMDELSLNFVADRVDCEIQ